MEKLKALLVKLQSANAKSTSVDDSSSTSSMSFMAIAAVSGKRTRVKASKPQDDISYSSIESADSGASAISSVLTELLTENSASENTKDSDSSYKPSNDLRMS